MIIYVIATIQLLFNINESEDVSANATSTRPIGALWPEALIPFKIDEDFFDKNTIHHIREAMNNWEASTCIRFVPYIDQPDHILITSDKTGYVWNFYCNCKKHIVSDCIIQST